jgi:hypothetical protein
MAAIKDSTKLGSLIIQVFCLMILDPHPSLPPRGKVSATIFSPLGEIRKGVKYVL